LKNDAEEKRTSLVGPCQDRCPIGRQIQRHNIELGHLAKMIKAGLAEEQEFLVLYDEISNINPLFGVCGYVCGICEERCNRNEIDSSVRNRLLERFIFDWYRSSVEKGSVPKYRPLEITSKKVEKVAVVGAGPAGLAAAFVLSKQGYKVSIFEREAKLGGALRWIPSYRLPKDALDFAIDQIVTPLNITVYTNTYKTIEELQKDGHKAIFVATGTPLPRPLPKVAEGYEAVENAIDLLRQASEGIVDRGKYAGKTVLVIGGSGVALDAARTAKRVGAEVLVACLESDDRSSKDGILAPIDEEIDAKEEGITFYYSRNLEKIQSENGRMRLMLSRCTSVYELVDGRKLFKPDFDRSDTISLTVDRIIFAIGQMPDRQYLKDLLDEKGRLTADPVTLATRKEGIFAGGDVLTIGRAAEAVKHGLIAAESIKRYLEGKDLRAWRIVECPVAGLPSQKEKIEPRPSETPKKSSVQDRLDNFDLIEKGLTLDEVISEAQRCLHCGSCENCQACVALHMRDEIAKMTCIEEACDGCGYCIETCPYGAIKLIEYMRDGEVKKTIDVNSALCRGCGSCQATCPKKGCEIAGFTLDELSAQIDAALTSPQVQSYD
jgi:NADPH-dependent glutamate synthase beta subunit-like oxidoreductase/NAD-dependent dihydropyrimidine dehydrogenase PreA subunit